MRKPEATLPMQISGVEYDTLLGILHAQVPSVRVWAFGSRVSGAARRFSDLDLGLDGKEPLELARRAELAEAFENSDLPFRVDLVDLAAAEPGFAERVRRTGLLLQQGGTV